MNMSDMSKHKIANVEYICDYIKECLIDTYKIEPHTFDVEVLHNKANDTLKYTLGKGLDSQSTVKLPIWFSMTQRHPRGRIYVHNKYTSLLGDIYYTTTKSSDSVTVVYDVNDFEFISKLKPLFLAIIEDMTSASIGCCSKYMECSDNMACVSTNPEIFLHCLYRKNLLKGKIFYGKNRNVGKKIVIVSNDDVAPADEPIQLSYRESLVHSVLVKILDSANLKRSEWHLERRSKNYLTYVMFNNDDFLRLKAGNNALWFSLDVWAIENDATGFEGLDFSKRHCKFVLSKADDLSKYKELILECIKNTIKRFKDSGETYDPNEYETGSNIDIDLSASNNNFDETFLSDYTIYDVETTELNIKTCDIVEIAALKIRNGKVVNEFSSLVKPRRKITEESKKKHCITEEMLVDSPYIEDILPTFLDFISDDVVVGHNIIRFDNKIIERFTETLIHRRFENLSIDTCGSFFQALLADVKDKAGSLSMDAIVKHLHLPHKNTHRALADCYAENDLYNELKLRQASLPKNAVFRPAKQRNTSRHISVLPMIDFSLLNTIEADANALIGKVCVITGTLRDFSRQEAEQCIRDLGGKVAKKVTTATDYLIVANNAEYRNKLEMAKKLNTLIITEDNFTKILGR